MNRPLPILLLWLAFATTGFSQHPTGAWDVFQTGAKGDGKTLDTQAIQTVATRPPAVDEVVPEKIDPYPRGEVFGRLEITRLKAKASPNVPDLMQRKNVRNSSKIPNPN